MRSTTAASRVYDQDPRRRNAVVRLTSEASSTPRLTAPPPFSVIGSALNGVCSELTEHASELGDGGCYGNTFVFTTLWNHRSNPGQAIRDMPCQVRHLIFVWQRNVRKRADH